MDVNHDFNSDDPFDIGSVRVTPLLNQLSHGNGICSLEPRLIEVLCYLASRAGDVISREELIRNVWHVDYGGDDSLSRAISILRKSFRELGVSGEVIETVPRRGYRLAIAPLERVEAEKPGTGPASSEPSDDAVSHQLSQDDLLVSSPRGTSSSSARVPLLFFLASAAFAIVSVMVWMGREPVSTSQAPPERSLAILPFTALTGSEADTLFAEGLAEEMMARFSLIDGLRMPGRTASRVYVENSRDIQSIGKDLGVNYILEGTVRREKDRIRINVDLSSTDSGYRLWSRSYDRAGDEALLIQEDIARRVANSLSARFLENGDAFKSVTGTTSVRAFNLYLEGRRYLNMRGGAIARAVERFETALEEDPNFARAAAGLASAHALSNRYLNMPDAIARSRAQMYAEMAVSLDGMLAEPHSVFGAIARDEQRWADALTHFDTALKRDADDLPSLHGHGEILLSLGFLEQAEATIDHALTVDPVSPVSHYLAGHIALAADDLDGAEQYYRRAQALGVGGAVFDRGLVLFRRGETEKAADLLATAYVHYQLIAGSELERLSAALQSLMQRESTVDIALRDFPTLISDDDARMLAFLVSGETGAALATLADDADGDQDGFHHIWTDLAPQIRAAPQFVDFSRRSGLLGFWKTSQWPDRCEAEPLAGLHCN